MSNSTHPAKLAQGSTEWKNYKAQYPVSGTAVGIIEGVNPHTKSKAWLADCIRSLEGIFKDLGQIPAVRHGNEMEPWARDWYEAEHDVQIQEAGIGHHRDHPWLVQSPDGLIGIDGGIEIKCVLPNARVYSVFDDNKKHYLRQVQLMMEVWDLEWVDFLCFKCAAKNSTPIDTVINRVDRVEGWLEELLPGRLLPVPKKGTVRRIDLYSEWHNHVHNEHKDSQQKQKYLGDSEPEVFDEVSHELFEPLTQAFLLKKEIEHEIQDAQNDIKELNKTIDEYKNAIADQFERSVTNGNIRVRVTPKTPPIDFKKAFEAVGGIATLQQHKLDIEDFRRTTNVRQVTIEGDSL